MNRTSMGPKPKIYSGSSKNTGGPLVRNRRDREEFSDNEPISEDDQDYADDQDQEEELPDITSNVNKERNTQSASKGHVTGHYNVKRVRALHKEVDDITRPKKKVTLHQKSLVEQVFTPAFLCQLVITIACVLLVNYCCVHFLRNDILVSDTTLRSDDKFVDIYNKVQKALQAEMNTADIKGKVKKAILENTDIGSKVQDTIDIKLTSALESQVPDIVRSEAESAVKGDDMKNVIKTQVSENSKGIKDDVEQSLSSKIASAFGIALDKNVETIEEAISGIVELKQSLAYFELKQDKAKAEVSELQNKLKSASESLEQLSGSYLELSTTAKHDSHEIGQLQTTVEKGEHRLKELNTALGELKQTVLDTNSLYEEYKHKVLELDDIRSRMDIIQPNMFNKDSFITAFMILIVIVLLLAVFIFNLYQRSNNDIPGRTGGRVKARQNNNMGHHEVLRLIPVGEELEPGVCIISFDESRATTHKRLLDSASIPNCKVKGHMIRRHEHIPNLPRCKVYLMCTEFSERHVIIEEPGKGLGDLHKTTYDAVMKLGGCLIILYTRDPGSRNLKDKVRYNERIYCVSNQPELAELNQDSRFFSVYDNLNNYQKTELRTKVTENMA